MAEWIAKMEGLLEEKFQEEGYQDLFLVETKYNNSNRLFVYIDSDEQLNIERCARLSRFLEKHIEENEWLGEKYTLEVSSPGVDRPLTSARQYRKNIGRTVSVKLQDEHKHVQGKLTKVEEDKVVVSYTEKRRIEGRRKKETVEVERELPFADIEQTVVKISFK